MERAEISQSLIDQFITGQEIRDNLINTNPNFQPPTIEIHLGNRQTHLIHRRAMRRIPNSGRRSR